MSTLNDLKEEYPRFAKYMSHFLSVSGFLLVFHVVKELVNYTEAARAYIEQTTPYVEAAVHGKMTAQDEMHRARLQKIFAEKLTPGEFQQNIDSINRALQPNPAPIPHEERIQFLMDMSLLRLKMQSHQVSQHPGTLIIVGCVLFYLGLVFQPKPKPAPPPPPPDKQPWEGAPIPPLSAPSIAKDSTESI